MKKEFIQNDIWVFIETAHNRISPVSLELLALGRKLAVEKGGLLTAVLFTSSPSHYLPELSAYGPDRIIIVNSSLFDIYNTDVITDNLCHLLDKYKPFGLLIGATENGRDFAPRVSSRLQTGLTADCTAIDYDNTSDCIVWTRPTFGGNLLASILCADHFPQMGTVRPGIFQLIKPLAPCSPRVIEEPFFESPIQQRILLKESISTFSNQDTNLDSADIIVAGGRGMGGPEGFQLLFQFADILREKFSVEVAVAASRAAVEEGWIDRNHQVGQTGKNVSPKIYIACGISGALQHTCGISNSDYIISINNDPEAPIIALSDYAIIGNIITILSQLMQN